jgi:hypothetical protein
MISLNSENYPAVFRSADEGANRNQRLYLWLIRIEYGLLFVAAVLSMEFFAGATFYLIYACVFLATLIVLLSRCAAFTSVDKTGARLVPLSCAS